MTSYPSDQEESSFLIDTHCHLDFDEFSCEREAILSRAREAGVYKALTISTFVEKLPLLLDLTRKYANLYCSVGTHPMNAEAESYISAERILSETSHEKVVAIGECGLDYHYQAEHKILQKKVFIEHINAAQTSQLPLIIHARNADEDMIDLLQFHSKEKSFPFVLHCYSSGATLAKIGLDLGGYISFSGIVTFKNAASVQEIARFVPAEKILVETDSPYLAPTPYRGKRNEPSFVVEVARYLAMLRNIEFPLFAQQTTKNALNLFKGMAKL